MTENKQEEKYKLEILEEVPQHLLDQLKAGDILLKATSLHKTFLDQPWQGELASDSRNALLVWRHRHPDNPEHNGFPYGRNLQEKVLDDGFSEAYYRVFGGEPDGPEMKMQKLIKLRLELGEPIGISKSFIKHYDKNGDIRRVVSLEDSITYKPQCNQCVTQEVIQMEEKEMKELVEKLQNELDDTKMRLESKVTTLEEKDASIKKLEDERKVFSDKLEELEAKLTSAEDEKSGLTEKFVQLSDAFKEFKVKAEVERKQPLIDEIFELEKDDDLLDLYKTYTIEKLEERREKVKDRYTQATIMTKTLDKEKKEALERLKAKDVGAGALSGLKKNDSDIAAEIEAEMKAEGLIN